jgi:signal peptidase I
MLSLILWTTLLIVDFLLVAAAMAWAARAVGSPRGRFRVGLRAMLVLLGCNLATAAINAVIGEPTTLPGMIAAALFWLVLQIAIALRVLKHTFQLSIGRTFAPLGALFGVTISFLALMVAVLKPHVSQAFVIPSGSMSPTLEPGDRFFVNKLVQPRRWDVIAYWNAGISSPSRTMYCKRVIGLPGETLRFDNGQIYINDQVQTAPAVVSGRLTANMPLRMSRYRDGQTISLGPAEFFVIGDNLPNSADSRFSGPSNTADIVGVMDLQYWPLSKFAVKR